nr:hypothetical protein BaRGS_006995 [Batillaria attramentaria]
MLAQVAAAKMQEPEDDEGGHTPPAPKKKDADTSSGKPSPKEKKSAEKKKQPVVVADENPEEDPKPKASKAQPKKVTKRSIQSLEEVTLAQIQALSNKALISLFAEMTANEMARNYTFTCYLMPDKCQESISSFGNETKARNSMINHLLLHIKMLAHKSGSEVSKRHRTTKPKYTSIKSSKSEDDMEQDTSDDQRTADATVEQPASPLVKSPWPARKKSFHAEVVLAEQTRRVLDIREKRVALKCIRELRGRKKDDKVTLACKICKDKSFTAEPFFPVKIVGRKFRHPSHFKPLQDAANTYKRHLKTRHGKLLTVFGIHPMSNEEFQKVRTKPYQEVTWRGSGIVSMQMAGAQAQEAMEEGVSGSEEDACVCAHGIVER